ncbi:amino acid adenylation domain-containing protein [Pseudoalteromonas luteoviolacea]|uniref:non-ribosomal peptide synthetase n=1 Tax=Pseudoalteromonas luteoviolacea TaxID=43657 RepID=UPI001F2AD879|nr:amino acid adenylation domain-containing protein [Pseudoalteromonas luteoviolacea]MCF6439125.1 amino acid adenylation domain-containing protein [Pseudoalteromonas luteoviolacea]
MSAAETVRSLLADLKEIGCRIWVEDGKLKVRTSTAGISPALKAQLKANKGDILTYLMRPPSAAISQPEPDHAGGYLQLPALQRCDRTSIFELSYGQQAFWFLYQNAPKSPAYNVAMPWRILSKLDTEVLQSALQALSDRHPSLRTTFFEQDGQAMQKVHAHQGVELTLQVADKDSEEGVFKKVREAYLRPFDLEEGPLFRAHLITQAEDKHVLLMTIHHIVFDGWSLWNLMSEFLSLYESIKGHRPSDLSPLPWCYQDYVSWQNALFSSNAGERLWSYWQKQLSDPPAPLDLPADRARSAQQLNIGASVNFTLSKALTEQLKTYVNGTGSTLYVVLLACFQVLLHRYTGQQDIWVGSAAAGRSLDEFKDICGCFFNFIVLRGKLEPQQSFASFLTHMQHTTLEALAHQDYPSLLLIERLALQRESDRFPLFQVEFNLQQPQQGHVLSPAYSATSSSKSQTIHSAGLTLEPFKMPQQEGQFDLSLDVLDVAGQSLSGMFRYNVALFDEDRIQRMLGHFEVILQAVVHEPHTSIAQLPLLTESEQQMWVKKPSVSSEHVPRTTCAHTLFEQHAASNPDATAVIFETQQLSYGELNVRANRLAHHLRRKGVGPDVLVGLFVERSIDIVVGILAILKAGGAYVPLDPEYPADRLSFMVEDADLQVLLCHEATQARLPKCEVQTLDMSSAAIAKECTENPEPLCGSNNLAYIIYTSGSTGKPKGVCVEHRNIVRLFDSTQSTYQFGRDDVWTLFHSHAFDFSVWEIWGALIYGGSLVIVPYTATRTPALFYQLLKEKRVSVLNQTPSAFYQLIEYEQTLSAPQRASLALRWVIFGGEALAPARLKPWYTHRGERGPTLVNMYGITETTVHVTLHVLQPQDAENTSSNIGMPISDLHVYILDQWGQPVPVGIPGELYVGGAGVTRGYLNRPELNAQRFIADPLNSESETPCYRTGDLCRQLSDGTLEYLGRVDTQVKVRGFRIECGEVESALLSHALVKAVVVDAWGEGESKQLVAWVRLDDMAGEPPQLYDFKSHLRALLPDWMIPTRFVFVDTLPLTPSGKIDRRALTVPDAQLCETSPSYSAPRNSLEADLCETFAELLGTSRVGIHDNFFDLGGHSILSMRLLSILRTRLGIEVPLSVLFQHPTPSTLALAIQENKHWQESLLVPLQSGGSEAPLFCIHPVGGSAFCYQALAESLGTSRSIYGVQALGLEGEAEPLDDIKMMAAQYVKEIITRYPAGPYHLYGWSMGGVIAFEMAHQLFADGREVGMIAIADSTLPSVSTNHQASKDDEVLLHLLAETGELSEAVFSELQDIEPERRCAVLRARLAQATNSLGPDEIAQLLPIYRANLSALSAYQANALNKEILYFSAAERLAGQGDSLRSGWQEVSLKVVPFEVVGNHFTMHDTAGTEQISEHITAYLTN